MTSGRAPRSHEFKAWRTTAAGITSIVSAMTRGRASNATRLSAIDAGYKVRMVDIQTTRAPEYDEWAEETVIRFPVEEEYARHRTSGLEARR